MIKRLGLLLFISILVSTFLYRPVDPAPVQAQDPIIINFYYPSATDAPVVEIFTRYAEAFNAENADVQVVLTYAGGYDDITAAAQNSLENGTPGPDVAVLLAVDLFNFIDNGYIIPAQQFIDSMDDGEAYVADFFPAFLENNVDGDGVIWTIPFQRSTPILFYNKDLFRAVGLDPDRPPQNREELVEYAQLLQEEAEWGIQIPTAGFPYWLFQSFAIANGQNVVGDDPTEVYLNAPEVVEALEFFISLSEDYGVAPSGAISFFDTDDDFLNEDAAMIYHTTGSLTFIRENADFEVGVGFLPSGPANEEGLGYGTPTGGGNLYIFSTITPEKQEAAWRWILYLTSPEIQADWTVNTGYIAARQSAWETDTLINLIAAIPEYAVARDQLQYAQREMSTHAGIEVRGIFNEALSRAINGEVDPQTALDEAQVEAEMLLADYK